MIFTETKIQGVFIIDLQKNEDERGYFARVWCESEFRQRGLETGIVQCSTSFNAKKGTLRGLHYQEKPHEETKIVRCTQGAVFDVVLDIRSDSPTFKQWVSVELSSGNGKMIYIPKGIAHGFQTLENDTEVFYQMSDPYHPSSARGILWNDPALAIQWPVASERTISQKDLSFPAFSEIEQSSKTSSGVV